MSRYQFPSAGTTTTDASLLVSGTLADARLSSNVALENVANVFTQLLSFGGTDTPGLQLKSLTTAQINTLASASALPVGSILVDSTTDRINARLARGTVELIDSAGGQTINGALVLTGDITTAQRIRCSASQLQTTNAAGSGFIPINTLSVIIGAGGPQLDSSSGTIRARNAAGSADAPVSCSNLTASGTVTSSGRLTASTGINIPNNQTLEFAQTGGFAGWFTVRVTAANLFVIGFNNGSLSLDPVSGSVTSSGPIVTSSTLRIGTFTVGTLPSASANTRARAFVTDSNLAFNSTNLGATVTAGGSTLVPVFSNGTNWVIG